MASSPIPSSPSFPSRPHASTSTQAEIDEISKLASQAAQATKKSLSERFASSVASSMVTRLISNINAKIESINVMVVQDSVSVGMTVESIEVR